MKKTKIVCTMGPNTNDREMMRKLIQNGMNVARFNFSHGDHEEQKFRMDMLKELRERNIQTLQFFWIQRDRKFVQES